MLLIVIQWLHLVIGNPDKGADYMDAVVKGIRQEAYGTDEQPNEINGLQTLVSMMG